MASRRREAVADVEAVPAEAEQIVGEIVGGLAIGAAGDDLLGESTEVLDQQDAQADGDRPQLADRQRLHLLVGAHHSTQAVGIEPAVGVGDVRPGQTEHPRVAGQVAGIQLGQLVVVVRRQVVTDLAELLVDDREVVDKPFGGRRDRAFVLDRPRQRSIGLDEDPSVLGDSRPDGPSAMLLLGDRLRRGQRVCVLLQPLAAEELGENRLGHRLSRVTSSISRKRV